LSHNKHVIDGFNRDIGLMQPDEAIEYYLELAEGWEDPNPSLVLTEHDGVTVVRDDLITGTKVRGADLLMSKVKKLDYICHQVKRFLIIKLVVLKEVQKLVSIE
jgi:hypothetical protein